MYTIANKTYKTKTEVRNKVSEILNGKLNKNLTGEDELFIKELINLKRNVPIKSIRVNKNKEFKVTNNIKYYFVDGTNEVLSTLLAINKLKKDDLVKPIIETKPINNKYIFDFGKYKGYDVEYVNDNNPNYIKWIIDNDGFDNKVRKIIKAELEKLNEPKNSNINLKSNFFVDENGEPELYEKPYKIVKVPKDTFKDELDYKAIYGYV